MITGPEICGFYSITPDREYEQSASALRYFIKPKLPIDLNKGIDDLKIKPDAYYQEKMERILTFIVNNKREYLNKTASTQNGESLIPSAKYITYRSILRMIICSRVSPYPWSIIATKYKGNIYLCQYSSQEQINDGKDQHSDLRNNVNYGSMLEHNCLSEHPRKKSDTSKACNANSQFFCVFKRELVNRQFLYAGEMDGTDSKTPLDPKNISNWDPNRFIELKTNCELNSRNVWFFKNVKLPRIWAQSYLTGVEKVYIGFYDSNGIVKQVRSNSVDLLGKMCKKNWNDSMDGFEYLDLFLNKVEADLKDIDCPYTTIKYSYNPNSKELYPGMHKGKTEYSILPEWYLQAMERRSFLSYCTIL